MTGARILSVNTGPVRVLLTVPGRGRKREAIGERVPGAERNRAS